MVIFYLPLSQAENCDLNQVRDGLEKTIKDSTSTSSSQPLRISAALIEDRKGKKLEEFLDIGSRDLERVASSQKIVTAYLVYKFKKKFKYPVTMSKKARVIGQSGENAKNWNSIKDKKLKEKEFLSAILVASSNGASFRALEIITGSSRESDHANLINKTIDELVPDNSTTFTNSHGLDNYRANGGIQKNFSRPLDMVKIGAQIYSDKKFQKFLFKNGFSTTYFAKIGSTKLAGKNDILYLKMQYKKEKAYKTNCYGEKFSIFFSALSFKNSRKKVMEYFGYRFNN